MDKVSKIWFDGNLVDWDDAKVHILTHALHYGTAVFEGLRCYKTDRGPAIFRLYDHVWRLVNSAKIYLMDLGYHPEEIAAAIKSQLRLMALTSVTFGRLHITVTERWELTLFRTK